MLCFGILQDCGYKVVLIIDGCMFGVFGKVFVVIYVILEVVNGGLIVWIQDGDMICVDVVIGELIVFVNEVEFNVCLLV